MLFGSGIKALWHKKDVTNKNICCQKKFSDFLITEIGECFSKETHSN